MRPWVVVSARLGSFMGLRSMCCRAAATPAQLLVLLGCVQRSCWKRQTSPCMQRVPLQRCENSAGGPEPACRSLTDAMGSVSLHSRCSGPMWRHFEHVASATEGSSPRIVEEVGGYKWEHTHEWLLQCAHAPTWECNPTRESRRKAAAPRREQPFFAQNSYFCGVTDRPPPSTSRAPP